MKRRDFLQTSALSGLALGITGCALPDQEKNEQTASAAAPSDDPAKFDLNEATVEELQQKMASGGLTSVEITGKYLARIKALDQEGPAINAVIERNPLAMEIARERDAERSNGEVRGPLHGIPFMIKDNIDTGDDMLTTAGSLALMGNKAKADAHIVKLLREAGAVLLGKTNLSEWANFRSTRSSSGWCSRGGQAKNPYVLNRNPCGSSSGSGAGVSANLATLTIGTETNGSVVCPASTNGVVGIKPTVGLASRTGIIPISFNQDTAGPMTRTVRDAAILLGAMAGKDPKDSTMRQTGRKVFRDYTQFLKKGTLRGAKIGIARQFFGFHSEVDKLMDEAIKAMEQEGAKLTEVEVIPGMDAHQGASFEVLLYEFKDGLNKYLAATPEAVKVKTLADVIEFNKDNAPEAMPFFGQEILEMAEKKGGLDSGEYQKALQTIQDASRKNGIDKVVVKNDLDAIIAPTGGPAWTTDLVNGDHYGGGSSSPAAWSGYPNITVPAGFVHGLPVGMSFFGTAWSEPQLLKVAYGFEQLTRHRKVPEFREFVVEERN